jgi:hypothetical protein
MLSKVESPYWVEGRWQDINEAQSPHREAIETIQGWFNPDDDPKPWTPEAYRIPTPKDQVFSVVLFGQNPSGYSERSGLFWRNKQHFIDLPLAIRYESNMSTSDWVRDGGDRIKQVTLIPPVAIGPYPSATDIPNQQVNRIGVDRITLGLFEYYAPAHKPAGIYDEHRVRVNIELFDALERAKIAVKNLTTLEEHGGTTIETVFNLTEDDIRKILGDSSVRNGLSGTNTQFSIPHQQALIEKYFKIPAVY